MGIVRQVSQGNDGNWQWLKTYERKCSNESRKLKKRQLSPSNIPEKCKWQRSWTVQRTNNAAPTATENRTVVTLATFEPRRKDSAAPEKGTADTDAEALLVSEVLLGVPEIEIDVLLLVVVERDDLDKIGWAMHKDISRDNRHSRAPGRTRRGASTTSGRVWNGANWEWGSHSVDIRDIAYVGCLQSVATTERNHVSTKKKKWKNNLIYPTGTLGSVRVSSWGAGSTLFAIPNELWKISLMRKKDHVSLRVVQRTKLNNLRNLHTGHLQQKPTSG